MRTTCPFCLGRQFRQAGSGGRICRICGENVDGPVPHEVRSISFYAREIQDLLWPILDSMVDQVRRFFIKS